MREYTAGTLWKSLPNPCPCGFLTDPAHACVCAPVQVRRYRSRVSGPLLDRIDIHIDVPAVAYKELSDGRPQTGSRIIRERVRRARLIQARRYKQDGIFCNAQLRPGMLPTHCRLGPDSRKLIETAMDRLGLSARAYDRIIKVARTIADLEGSPEILTPHVSEAIQYRSLDRRVVM